MNETPAAEIARAEKPYFPDIDESVLADCIATYQQLGCWTPHVEITRAAYEKTLDVFEYNGAAEAALSLRAGLRRAAGNRLETESLSGPPRLRPAARAPLRFSGRRPRARSA